MFGPHADFTDYRRLSTLMLFALSLRLSTFNHKELKEFARREKESLGKQFIFFWLFTLSFKLFHFSTLFLFFFFSSTHLLSHFRFFALSFILSLSFLHLSSLILCLYSFLLFNSSTLNFSLIQSQLLP